MANKDMRSAHKDVVDYLLKKSEQKDTLPQAHVDNLNIEEVEALTKKIKEKIKV